MSISSSGARAPVEPQLAAAAETVIRIRKAINRAGGAGLTSIGAADAKNFRDALKAVAIGIREDKAGRIKALADKYLSAKSTETGLEQRRRKMGIPIAGFDDATIQELKWLGCQGCGECRWEGQQQGTHEHFHCMVNARL